MKKMLVVGDLDGTTAVDKLRREQHLSKEPKDYRAYHLASAQDEPNMPIVQTLIALVDAGHRVEIWTGREEQYRKPTQAWLQNAFGDHAARIPLRMRETGESRSTNEVKESWAREPGNWPDLVFDDRNKTSRHWREMGILCAQVAENT